MKKQRITLRLPADLHAWLVAQAKADRRSLNSEIVHLLETDLSAAAADANALTAIRLPLPCSAGVRFLPGLKAGASSEGIR